MWQLITDHGVNVVTVIGDAVARPFIDEYLAHPDRYDPSTLFSISSGAVPLSPAGRAEIAATFPNVIINDGYGASETGAQAANTGDGRFASYDDETTVIDPATITEVVAGSGQQGRVARRGHIPLGYYGDSEKTAQTFVEKDGVRWVLTGDVAEILADGTIQLFGRGSMCINTGGEKVYPEEVENVLAGHPGVYDSLVVGVPDPRWGAGRGRRGAGAGDHDIRRRPRGLLPRAAGGLQAAPRLRVGRRGAALAGGQGRLRMGQADRGEVARVIVQVHADGDVTLEEREDFNAFKVVAPAGVDVDAALKGSLAGLVSADGGAHILVAWVRQYAVENGAPISWDDDYLDMLGLAREHGWIDPTGHSIQAHIEREGAAS